MNIFFYGGTFDPPHIAHEHIYKYCLKYCDKFIFFPAKSSPGKSKPICSPKQRIDMLNLLIKPNDKRDKVFIDDFEIKSINDPSYTIETVNYLKSKYPKSNLSMVVGYDQFKNIKNWRDSGKIKNSVKIICFDRDSKSKIKHNIINFDHKISSSEIRILIRKNKINLLNQFLNKEIINYITNNNLYKS